MKKMLAGFLCAATMVSAAVPTFAAKANNAVGPPNPTAVVMQESSESRYALTAPQSLGVAPTNIKGYTYVPVDFYKILKSDKPPDSIEIANPLVNCKTLDKARKLLGFSFAVPATLPDGYKMGDIIVINNVAEIFYKNGNKEILYRTAKGNEDISGNYTVYDEVKTITVGNTKVTVKCKGDSINNLATWAKEGVSFSLSFDESINIKALTAIIESIK